MTLRLPLQAGGATRRADRCTWCTTTDVEFAWYSAALGEVLDQATADMRVAATCRGSGDRPVLTNLATALRQAPPGGPVIDVGAGLGGPSTWLQATTGLAFFGVEPSMASVRVARALFPGLHVVPGTATALPLADGAASAVTMIGVLSLLGDARDAALAEAGRVLRPGGVLAVTDVVAPHAADRRHADLPQGTTPAVAGDVAATLDATGWTILDNGPDNGLDNAPDDEEWASLREEADDLVTTHVMTTPHGVRAACPHAWHAEREARHRMGVAMESGLLRRETLVAQRS